MELSAAKERALSLLGELVRIPTWEGNSEANALRFLQDWLHDFGIRSELRSDGDQVLALVSRLGDPSADPLIFNSHVDTVPPSGKDRWRSDPFELTLKDGTAVGLGATDAKGCVAAMLSAYVALRDVWPKDRALELMIVGAEERGGAGTRLQTRSGLRGAVIVGEPTSLIPCVATKGSARVDVVVRGKAAHASNPKEGVNAVYPMAALIVELERLAERVSETTERWTGSSSLAVTLIQGGTAQNVIPSECRIHIDRRLVPGERAEPAIAQVERLVREVAERYPDASFEVLPGLGLEPVVIETDEPLVEAVLNATGKRELTGFTACCDLTFLVHEGGIPGVIWGPGSLSEAHQVNETLPLPEFEEAVAMYYKAALAWAGVQAS